MVTAHALPRHLLAAAAAAVAVSGLGPITPSPAHAAAACSKTLTAGGDPQTFIASLSPGQTGCLVAGTTYGKDVIDLYDGGTATAPVRITSTDPSRPATIRGRIVMHPGADYVVFDHLKLDGRSSTSQPSPTVASDHTSWTYDDVTNAHTGICFNIIDSPTWGTAHYTLVDHSRIHACGESPPTNLEHGLYVIGYYTTITNNFIYDNADRGVQLRNAHHTSVLHNVIDGNGEGVIYGDANATDDEVAYNIISNSKIRWNVESWWTAGYVADRNTLHDNCLFASNATTSYDTNGGVDGGAGYTAFDNKIANPAYEDRANADFTLQAGSPCAGYGPDTAQPPAAAPPLLLTSPVVSGTASPGAWLYTSNGTWKYTAPASVAYQWLRCDATGATCTPILGATYSRYSPAASDSGHRLRSRVSVTDPYGTTSAASAPSAVVG